LNFPHDGMLRFAPTVLSLVEFCPYHREFDISHDDFVEAVRDGICGDQRYDFDDLRVVIAHESDDFDFGVAGLAALLGHLHGKLDRGLCSASFVPCDEAMSHDQFREIAPPPEKMKNSARQKEPDVVLRVDARDVSENHIIVGSVRAVGCRNIQRPQLALVAVGYCQQELLHLGVAGTAGDTDVAWAAIDLPDEFEPFAAPPR
jgi:hypothetical protein